MKRHRIVLVDDEEPILLGLKNHVPWNDLGYEVAATCSSASQALAVIRDQSVDVVLTDIRMPGMDGLEFCRVARREYPRLTVILLSAWQDFEYARRAMEHGAWRYLLKPTNHGRLHATLEELRVVLDGEAGEGQSAGADSPQLVETVRQWVESHLQHASLEGAAEEVGLNPQYLSRRYRELAGQGFSELVQQLRMERAAQLLIGSRYRTYEISSIVGYSNPRNFNRRFREYWGCTPGAYRKRGCLS